MRKFDPVQNHPECHRTLLGVYGPRETKDKVIITNEPRMGWCWRYKRSGEIHYIFIGKVSEITHLFEEIRITNLVASIY